MHLDAKCKLIVQFKMIKKDKQQDHKKPVIVQSITLIKLNYQLFANYQTQNKTERKCTCLKLTFLSPTSDNTFSI